MITGTWRKVGQQDETPELLEGRRMVLIRQIPISKKDEEEGEEEEDAEANTGWSLSG